MNMVERVAKAMIEGFDQITEPDEREDCLRLARAVIAAMREPTEAMVCAGEDSMTPGNTWRWMIDAALK